jgi:hypothetical protein
MSGYVFSVPPPALKALAFETGYAATFEADGEDDTSWTDTESSPGSEKTSQESSSVSSSSPASSVDSQRPSYDELLQRVASLEKNFSSMKQAMIDKQEELDEREASVSKREAAVSKREEALKAFTAKANDKVIPEADKAVKPKRKRMSRIVKALNKAFPPEKAVIVFQELKHKALRMSKVGKATLKDIETQLDMVLALYKLPASEREQHVTMLIDLINFEDSPNRLLNATVNDAAIEYANEGLAKWLFLNNRWLSFEKVSAQHKNIQAIKTIAHLETSLFDMDLALISAAEPDEFDDEEISETPSGILKKYYEAFSEYGSALYQFLCAVPESSPLYELVKAHGEHEGLAMYDGWTKAAHKFGVEI